MIDGVEEVAEWRWENAGVFELQLAEGGAERIVFRVVEDAHWTRRDLAAAVGWVEVLQCAP